MSLASEIKELIVIMKSRQDIYDVKQAFVQFFILVRSFSIVIRVMKNTFGSLVPAYLLIVLFGMGAHVKAQTPPPPSQDSLYSSIQAQEANFPLPQTQATITVGTVDLSKAGWNKGFFYYSVPTYTDGTYWIQYYPIPPSEQKDYPKGYTGRKQIENLGAQVSVANILHLSLRFVITNWASLPSQSSLAVKLGSQTQTVQNGAMEIVFSNVVETAPSLAITVNGAISANGQLLPLPAPGLLPVEINWVTLAAGAITIPAIPVLIVYAPVADAGKLNQASAVQSTTTNYTTTISFTTQNSSTVPISSQFQEVSDIAKGMTAIGTILSKIPNQYTVAIGGALNTIASALGTSTATQTTGISVTSQHALGVSTTVTLSQGALSKNGGPGVGDVITFLYNVRVVWFSDNGQMSLAIIGKEGVANPTAQQLQNALNALQAQPAGTKDPNWHIDAATIQSLLNLDPFVAGGPSAVLSPPRFVDVSQGVLDLGGGPMNYVASHTVTATDISTTVSTTNDVENDNAGMLSFLGIGVTQNQTLQAQISQSCSSQDSVGQTLSETYMLNGNGNEHYECEVYYDVAFGSFAFRQIVADQQPAISGSLSNPLGKALPNSRIIASVNGREFISVSDSLGQFAIRLPGISAGHVKISSGDTKFQVEYNGSPINGLELHNQQ